jgi:hypothetical protein
MVAQPLTTRTLLSAEPRIKSRDEVIRLLDLLAFVTRMKHSPFELVQQLVEKDQLRLVRAQNEESNRVAGVAIEPCVIYF